MSKKRYLKATEVEQIFNEARENDKEFMIGEKAIVKTIVETAKRNGRIGDKVLMVISPYYIHIPRWQRKADLARAREIGMHYDKDLWEVPKIVIINGVLMCVDGMHRILGALLAGITDIVVEVIEKTEKEAIELFLNQTNNRGKMSPSDYYNGAIEAEKPEYIAFRDVCHKHHVQIKGDDTLTEYKGIFTSLLDGTGTNVVVLDKILTLIHELGWNGDGSLSLSPSKAAYGSKVIRSLKALYAHYIDNEIEMEKILCERCSGMEYYMENIADKSQYKIFDFLMEEVKKGVEKRKSIKSVSKRTA